MYQATAIVSSVVSTLIGILWILHPAFILKKWAVGQPSSRYVVEHRLGALLIAVGVILFLSSGAARSAARTAISLGVIAGCSLLLVQNVRSLIAGSVGKGIVTGMVLQAMAIVGFALSEFLF